MLRVADLRHTYGTRSEATEAIGHLTFEIGEREFLCVVGPNGCGKTTLLRCMSGLLVPTSGGVYLHGDRIERPPERMALVFQDYTRSLFPWMTVRQNVAFPLRRGRLPARVLRERVGDTLESVDLSGSFHRYPWELSGGMQQRVAIARALAYRPEILLMDEPFASVDAESRADLEDLILRVRVRYGVTVVFVTHDIDEAVYLGDRVLVLSPAPTRLQQALAVDLPQPRDQIATREQPEFTRLRTHIYRSIRGRSAHAGRSSPTTGNGLRPGLGAGSLSPPAT